MRHLTGVLLLLALGRAVLAADSFPIHVYPCPKATTAPVLDGQLSDPVWQSAAVVSGFTLYDTGDPANPQTFFRVLWDERCLYFAVHCDEPLMDQLIPLSYSHDDHSVFGSEAVELFVDPDHNHARYYQIAVNAAGTVYDGEGVSTAWNSETRVKTALQADGWSLEAAIPWGAMSGKPQAGKVVGFNVSRDRKLGTSQYSAWTRVDSNLGFHDPERFAHLVLSGTAEVLGGLAQEYRKGGRTGPVVIFSAEGFARTTYARLAADAFTRVERLLADMETARARERNPEAAREIKRRLDDYTAQVTALKAGAAQSLDAVAWTRLDLALQTMMGALHKTVGEARLQALLDRI